jgi:hypothetical protein
MIELGQHDEIKWNGRNVGMMYRNEDKSMTFVPAFEYQNKAEKFTTDDWDEFKSAVGKYFEEPQRIQEVAVVKNGAAPAVQSEATHVSVQSDTSALMALIERAARDPEVDLDRMERLFSMHEAMKSKQAEVAFKDAMAAAQFEIGPVVAKKRNDQTHSKYADLAAILEVAQPIIAKHGLSTSFGTEPCDVPNHYRVTCEVSHGGFSKTYKADIPMDGTGLKGNANKTATHTFGSTMTYGRRYLFCMIFNIATADDDGNAASAKRPATISEKQIDEMYDLIAETGTDIDGFLKTGKLEPLGEDRGPAAIKERLAVIHAVNFANAMTMIRKAHANRMKKAKQAETAN